MKFNSLFPISLLLAALFLISDKADAQSNSIQPFNLVNSDDVIGPDSEAVRIPIAPDIRGSYCRSAKSDSVLRLAIVLSDINGKKDTEFSRGFLMGMQKVEIPDGSLSLKMINGDIPQDSLTGVLNEFNPGVIFSTHDKEMPKTLLDYATSNYVKLFSPFDARGEEYKKYPGVYQLLTPSLSFNQNAAKFLTDAYSDHIILFIGDPDENDQILLEMVGVWPEEQLMLIDKEQFSQFKPQEGVNYLIYPAVAGEAEISAVMAEIKQMMQNNPLTGFRVIGRPNWVTINNLDKVVDGVEVLVPSKCYFDTSSDGAKRFIVEYKENFEHTPIRSFPVYSVMGYDAARYFLPVLIGEIQGTVGEWKPQDMLQSYFSIGDNGWTQGAFNKGFYILHYLPANKMKKDLVN